MERVVDSRATLEGRAEKGGTALYEVNKLTDSHSQSPASAIP